MYYCCHGQHFMIRCCCFCLNVMLYIVSSQFGLGYKCSTPCCEEDFSWQKIMVLILQYFYNLFQFLVDLSTVANFMDIAYNGLNGMWKSYVVLVNKMKQTDRHMTIVFVDDCNCFANHHVTIYIKKKFYQNIEKFCYNILKTITKYSHNF